MKIIINGKFLSQRITGVQRYAREILCELDKICTNLSVELVAPQNVEFPNFNNIKCVNYGKRSGTLWEQLDFAKYVRKSKGISLNLCNSAPLFCKKIVVIHDVKVKVHPEYFSKKFALWYKILFNNATKKARHIITVSQFSKSEIIKHYKVLEDKISVIYNAWQHYLKVEENNGALDKYSLNANDYFFAMCSLEPNKNLNWILNVAKNNSNCNFAVAGGFNKSVFSDNSYDIPSNVRLIGYVNDDDAKYLLKNCKAFLFPTFYEGFGIPPIEALVAGANKLIVTDSEVMHEVLGDAPIYINPNKYDYNLNELISDSKPILNAEEILNKYSWKKSAQELYKLLIKLS